MAPFEPFRWLSRFLTSLAVMLAALAAAPAPAAAQSFPPYPGTQPTKEADRASVPAGGTITWTITIFNDAADDPATVYLTDNVPEPFDIATDLISKPAGSTASYNAAAPGTLSVNNIQVPGRGQTTIVFQTRVPANAPSGQICNRAAMRYIVTICSGGGFPLCEDEMFDSTTNEVCVTVQGAGAANIEASQADSDFTDHCAADPSLESADIQPGETLDLTLAIENTGGASAGATPPGAITGTLQPGAGFTIVSGASPYQPSNLAPGDIATNVNPFVIRVDQAITCPSTLDLDVRITNITGGPYTVSYQFPVGGRPNRCDVCGAGAPCSAAARALAEGPTRYCEGGTVRLDGSGSDLTNCTGVPEYQWSANGVPIAGATAAAYDVPATQPAGVFTYTVEVTCSTDPSCGSVSNPIDVTIDPTPLDVVPLHETRTLDDIHYWWSPEPTATGGYRIYRTSVRDQADLARGGNPAASLAGSAAPADTMVTVAVEVQRTPALLFYQALAVCSDGITEGPN